MPRTTRAGRDARRPTALVLDFDGTLCPVDITAELHRALARPGWRQELLALRSEAAGSRLAQERLLPYLPQDLDPLLEFALGHDLDPAVRPLVEAAKRVGWEVEVISDGYGFYVPAMLARGGIRTHIRCADVVLREGLLRLVAPWASRGGTRCPSCTTCKLDAVADHHAAGRRVVLVGDGRSDRIAAGDADVVYATESLAEHCTAVGIPFRAWHHLADVLADLRGRGELPDGPPAPRPPGERRRSDLAVIPDPPILPDRSGSPHLTGRHGESRAPKPDPDSPGPRHLE